MVTLYLLDMQPGLYKVLAADDGTTETRFVHDMRGVLAEVDSSDDWHWMGTDGLGSVRLQSEAGALDFETQYSPYGEPFDVNGSASLFGYTGEPTDANGLVHLRARYYEPNTGVFLNLDPMETSNRYAYVSGNPVNRIDPSGHCWLHPDSTENQRGECRQAFINWTDAVQSDYPDWSQVSGIVRDEVDHWAYLSYPEFVNQWNNPNVHLPSQNRFSAAAPAVPIITGGAVVTQGIPVIPGPDDVVGGVIIFAGVCYAGYLLATAEAITLPQRIPFPTIFSDENARAEDQEDAIDRPIPLPIIRERGSCDEDQFIALRNEKQRACDSRRLGCKSYQTREELLERIIWFGECIAARLAIIDNCFGGQPDEGHQRVIDLLRVGLAKCHRFLG